MPDRTAALVATLTRPQRQHRTGTVEVCGKYSYAAYVRPDAGNRHWVPKRKLRRYVDGTPTTTTSPHR